MNIASIAYMPVNVPGIHSEAFKRNISAYKTQNPVIFFSDSEGFDHKIDSPLSLKESKNKVAIHNYLFLSALKIAIHNKLDRFIYLESDCRVSCDLWDDWIFDEVDNNSRMIVAGTPAIWHQSAMDKFMKAMVRDYCYEYTNRVGLPIAHFYPKRATSILARRENACSFIMGAGAVYDVASVKNLFEGFEQAIGRYAITIPAFDQWIGMKIHSTLRGAGISGEILSRMPFITSMFSGYKNRLSTEHERIEMVRNKRFALVHQIKSDNDCLN